MRKPFFKKSHGCWYVRVDGKDVRLDSDEHEAHRLWLIMADSQNLHDNASVAALCEAWMTEHQSQIKQNKFGQAAGYILGFVAKFGQKGCLEVSKGMLHGWLSEEKPGRQRKDGSRGPSKPWAQSTKKDAAGIIKRIYRWAHDEGKLSRNPFSAVKIADGSPRVVLIDPDEHRRVVTELMKTEEGRPLALYLIASKCGCRPRHIREVTTANVTTDYQSWVFDDHKSKDKVGRKLVVHLHPCVSTLTKILAHKQGPLFTNVHGEPWKKDTIVRRLHRLRKRMNLPSTFIAYAYRHTFATEALLAGVHIATVATLMGHTDSRMATKVYGHLDQHTQHLKDAAAQAAARRFKS